MAHVVSEGYQTTCLPYLVRVSWWPLCTAGMTLSLISSDRLEPSSSRRRLPLPKSPSLWGAAPARIMTSPNHSRRNLWSLS